MSETYKIPLVPGPTSVPEFIRKQYLTDFGSADLEEPFFELYAKTQKNLQIFLNTKNKVAIMSGEGMVALWGAMKSVLTKGDKVLCVSSGLFGDGFADMAKAIGCDTLLVKGKEGDSPSPDEVREKCLAYKPKLISFVQCETPSGIINNVEPFGQIAKECGSLFMVVFVSSAGSTPVKVDEWGIDLGLLGTQKCLSCLPDLGIITISEKAWKVAKEVNYSGYDAILPFENALEIKYFPYTPNWHAISALNVSLEHLIEEGLSKVYQRHYEVAKHTRDELKKMGLIVYPVREELCSPSVTGVYIPNGWTWDELNKALREKGVFCGGTFGDLSGKIFRIGHMGSQATIENVDKCLNALKEILATKQ